MSKSAFRDGIYDILSYMRFNDLSSNSKKLIIWIHKKKEDLEN
ncbi:hypothetical protein LEP1GSC082_0796 [Leptospira kirschneri str. H2]|uniref:Uncharacterized protein n=2 Tax=Leptospira kirschneri TaxID=29507 RepID=A0A0E2B5K5_9LEPT|nr:hypothetical protein LEP1GSC081_2896 [Leptospira kirschneri str. H1]EKO60848.1 hypothetical protein LEP1GSC082_0796 [Leptospira kirschneri str. H2]EMK23749.1 hypothetical protein LEP1GSC008_2185 [Leptospira kirschneri serovar Bulgarica str. Nikolaevo]